MAINLKINISRLNVKMAYNHKNYWQRNAYQRSSGINERKQQDSLGISSLPCLS